MERIQFLVYNFGNYCQALPEVAKRHRNNESSDADVNTNQQESIEKTCNCRSKDKATCPLKGNCLVCCLVYRATVTRLDNCHCETYTGVTAGTFKCRWYGHCHDIRHRPKPEDDKKGTTLSNYVWQLKDQNIQYNLGWEVVTNGADFNPATGICGVCTLENFLSCSNQVVPL